MRRTIGGIAILAAVAGAGAADAQDRPRPSRETGWTLSEDFEFGVHGAAWLASPQGNHHGDEGRVSGSTISLDHDLDADGLVGIPVIEAHLDLWQTWRAEVSYWYAGFDGKATFDRARTFEGTVIPAGAGVDAEIRAHRAQAFFSRTFVFPGRSALPNRLEAGLGVKVFSYNVQLDATSGASDAINGTFALPVVGVRAEFLFYEDSTWTMGSVLWGDVASLPLGSHEATLTEAEFELNASWKRRIYAGVGYRVFYGDTQVGSGDGDDEFRLGLQGLTLSFMVWF